MFCPLPRLYDKAAFQTLVDKPEARSIRIYYGMDEDLKLHAIIVAVNENNEDIVPTTTLGDTGNEDIIESGVRCPELCPEPSPLNS